ncbi:MAG: DUF2202 domain-containing protein [Verrucomicrobiales bacterium]
MKNSILNWSIVAAAGAGMIMVPAALALTPVEISDIEYIRQEEKVARDVYDQLYSIWGKNIFSNIASSERNHIAAMVNIMAAYGLVDSTPSEPGQFSIPELQALHDELLEKGKQSLVDALLVGVLIEETDIADLARSIELSNQEDVKAVYESLRKGSENHLAAFSSQLAPLYKRLEVPVLNVDFDGDGFPVLTWLPSSPDATGIEVSRQVFGSDQWELVSELPRTAGTLNDTSATGVVALNYRVAVVSGFEKVDSNVVTVLRPFLSFADWAEAANIPKNLSLPHIDADRDGATNLFEYLSGRNPLIADVDPMESLNSADSAVFTHALRSSASDYTVGYQAASDLVEWSSIPEQSIEHESIGAGFDRVRITLPANTRASFLRTVAEQL